MLREWQTVNQAALSPHEMHCHQYLAIRCRYLTEAKLWSITATTSDRPGWTSADFWALPKNQPKTFALKIAQRFSAGNCDPITAESR
jgi:hypothetical protein